MNEPAELESFKREIDVRQFATSLGYEIDKRDSWRGSTVMRSGADKIVVKRNRNGHYVFFSVRDDKDNGTIIDFLQHRQKMSLGEVRKALRPWIGKPAVTLPLFPKLEATGKDRICVEREYRRMSPVLGHPYLEHERCLPATLLSLWRFAGRIRMDARRNVVFPHFDREGLCGYEIKNHGFTGFAAGGTKGLWFSHTRLDDTRLVLAESAIDALSYAALFPDAADRTRYASLGGRPNSQQPSMVKATIARLPKGSEIVAAFDADDGGRSLVDVFRLVAEAVATETGRTDLLFRVRLPAEDGADWNQILQGRFPSSAHLIDTEEAKMTEIFSKTA
jgi:hypothetical protein